MGSRRGEGVSRGWGILGQLCPRTQGSLCHGKPTNAHLGGWVGGSCLCPCPCPVSMPVPMPNAYARAYARAHAQRLRPCLQGGGIPRGDFSAGKIPYFNLVRNFVHVSHRTTVCLVLRRALPFVLFPLFCSCCQPTGKGGAGIICEWRATPSTEVIPGTMVIAFSQDLLGIAIPGSLLLPMH